MSVCAGHHSKQIAARTSPTRFTRHTMRLKAPRGWGWLTEPWRLAGNRIYTYICSRARSVFGMGGGAVAPSSLRTVRLVVRQRVDATQNRTCRWPETAASGPALDFAVDCGRRSSQVPAVSWCPGMVCGTLPVQFRCIWWRT